MVYLTSSTIIFDFNKQKTSILHHKYPKELVISISLEKEFIFYIIHERNLCVCMWNFKSNIYNPQKLNTT